MSVVKKVSPSILHEPSLIKHHQAAVQKFCDQASGIILGKERQIQLALCALLARGHLLIEDVPGVGKTTLVKVLAQSLGLKSSRVQFTNDLLPADIVGTSIFNANSGEFSFHPGPIFAQVVIADELNRATPKTQSACLEAMEERRVTVDGGTYPLPEPFFVIATQNPREQMGTYSLPESQLDRFLMRIELGYPEAEFEKALLKGKRRDLMLADIQVVIQPEILVLMQAACEEIHSSESIVDYVQRILSRSRQMGSEVRGLSPRAGLALLRAAKAWAFMQGRDFVVPEDVQAVGLPVISHRLNASNHLSSQQGELIARQVLDSVSVD